MASSVVPPVDARRRPRPRMAMKGQIVHGVHHECADVVIRNLTDGGAKARLTSTTGVTIKGRVILRLDTGDHPCAVAWQSGDEVGLRFD